MVGQLEEDHIGRQIHCMTTDLNSSFAEKNAVLPFKLVVFVVCPYQLQLTGGDTKE